MIALPAAPPLSIRQLRILAREALKAAGIENYEREADWVLAHACNLSGGRLLSESDRTMSSAQAREAWRLIERRTGREPLQYILGTQEFRGLEMIVSPDVLIPRPETECLVDEAIESIHGQLDSVLADVGTGSGCVAIAIARECPHAFVCATDISRPALLVAQANAARHGVQDQVRFVAADLVQPFRSGIFDAILSNPPYIATDKLDSLQPEVAWFEPRCALEAGPDGLAYYRRLLLSAPSLLKPHGHLIVELGFGQADDVNRLAERTPGLRVLRYRKDQAGIDRVLVMQRVC